jgi:subtilisin family serine protease
MATPHVSAAAALLLEQDPTLAQAEVEEVLTATALPIPANGGAVVHNGDPAAPAWVNVTWDTDCAGIPCDPVGAGLLQVAPALASLP